MFKKRIKINSSQIKLMLMEYFRYKRQFIGVVSEFSFYLGEIEDIVAFNSEEIVVVEIKISKADFLKDFKKSKHSTFKKPYNRFYFFATNNILEFVLQYLKENNYNDYGVLSINGCGEVYVAKSANILKGSTYPSRLFWDSDKTIYLKSLIARMSSELIQNKRISINKTLSKKIL